jgi:peptide/nickel transport system substrate-binding protein
MYMDVPGLESINDEMQIIRVLSNEADGERPSVLGVLLQWIRRISGGMIPLVLLAGVVLPVYSAGEAEEAAADRTGEEIVIAAPRDAVPGEEDFFYSTATVRVWEPLVGVDEEWKPVPQLAEDWEHSDDATEWTFFLREGVRFHDGTRFDADAVLANFERYEAVGVGSSQFYSFSLGRFYPGYEGIEKVDDYTIRLTFDRPKPMLPYAMTSWGSAMFSPDSFDEDGDFAETPAGTGQFEIIERQADEYAVLGRFDDYWGEPAASEQIRIRMIPQGSTRVSALRAEEVMGLMDIGAIRPLDAQQLASEDRFEVLSARSSIIHYLALNGTQEPFNDVRMRRAVSLAIDRELIAEEFYYGYADPAPHILNHASPFYESLPIEHDPDLAQDLAREVLGDERYETTMIVPSGFLERYPYTEKAEYLQDKLSTIGIDVEIQPMEWGALNEAMENGEFGLVMRIQGLPNGDPASIFESFMHSEGGQNQSYSLGYANDRVDELIDTLPEVLDMDERRAVYTELQEISAEELPVVPLVNDRNQTVKNTAIADYERLIYGETLHTVRWSE